MKDIEIFNLTWNSETWAFSLTINIMVALALVVVAVLAYLSMRRYFRWQNKNSAKDVEIVPVELTYGVGQSNVKYQIVRNYVNVEIAFRIYIELITRKAALEVDEEHDVIAEGYDSWYKLFQLTRDEIKTLSGNLLEDNAKSEELIRLSTDILNKGLRPHLTEYQARFRRWYNDALTKPENKNRSPQEIQKGYPRYTELIASMKAVNKVLMQYADQLHKFIKG